MIKSNDTNVLLKLFDFGPKHSNLLSLWFGIPGDDFEAFVELLVFISLYFNIGFEGFVVAASVDMQLVLSDFSLFNKDIDHYVNFFSDLVTLFFEQLQLVIAFD